MPKKVCARRCARSGVGARVWLMFAFHQNLSEIFVISSERWSRWHLHWTWTRAHVLTPGTLTHTSHVIRYKCRPACLALINKLRVALGVIWESWYCCILCNCINSYANLEEKHESNLDPRVNSERRRTTGNDCSGCERWTYRDMPTNTHKEALYKHPYIRVRNNPTGHSIRNVTFLSSNFTFLCIPIGDFNRHRRYVATVSDAINRKMIRRNCLLVTILIFWATDLRFTLRDMCNILKVQLAA